MRRIFQGVLEPVDIGISSVMVRIPFDPVELWPVRSKLRVRGTIRPMSPSAEALPFAASLLRSQKHGYFLLVTGRMRKALHISAGARLEVTLEPDLDGLAATPPPEFAKFLKSDRSLRKWFATLTYSTRKYIADDIQAVKSAEARKRRAELWAERLMLTMEGEEEIPPILQVAFRRQPLGRAGWESQTLNQRRMQLLSLFTCQSPESRIKRADRVAADAALRASGKGTRARNGREEDEY